MLSLEKCRKILDLPDLSEEDLKKIRGSLYYFVEKGMEEYLIGEGIITPNEK